MSDIKTQLRSYLETTPEVTFDEIMDAATPAAGASAELARPRSQRSDLWRGPLVAAGTAAAIILGIAAVMLSLRAGSDSVPVVDQVTPPITVAEIGAFTPRVLSAPPEAEWSVGSRVEGLHHGVAYIDSIDSIIMFGGHAEEAGANADFVPNDQTLLIDLATSTVEILDAPGPPARSFHALAYDRQSDRVIMFGGAPAGYDGTGDLDDTWAFDPHAETWDQMSPVETPPPQSFHDMTYHADLDRIALIAREIWTYDYETDTWEQLPHWTGPPWHGYLAGSAVVDDTTGMVVTVTESNRGCGPETRTTDLATGLWYPHPFWNLATTCDQPPGTASEKGVIAASAIYDPVKERVIGYGIDIDRQTGVALAFDDPTGTWTRLGTGPEISRVPMVYDPERGQIVVFGSEDRWEKWVIWTMPNNPFGSNANPPE